jgi:hypothetical protein
VIPEGTDRPPGECRLQVEHKICSVQENPFSPLKSVKYGVQSEFGKLLKTLIYQHFRSARAFVREVGGFSSEDVGVSRVSQVIKGKLPPPFERLDAWEKVLKVEGKERRHFRDLAAIACLPDVARPEFEQLLARVERGEGK